MRYFLLSLASLFASVLLTAAAEAQTTTCHGRPITVLDFRNPVLISGSSLSAGAIYRFSNVATGVDARVSIIALNGATLATIDRDTGLVNNFQPELGGTDARSVDFNISFVTAGGTTPVALDVAASGIDVDGEPISRLQALIQPQRKTSFRCSTRGRAVSTTASGRSGPVRPPG